jgi:hypothetical protein
VHTPITAAQQPHSADIRHSHSHNTAACGRVSNPLPTCTTSWWCRSGRGPLLSCRSCPHNTVACGWVHPTATPAHAYTAELSGGACLAGALCCAATAAHTRQQHVEVSNSPMPFCSAPGSLWRPSDVGPQPLVAPSLGSCQATVVQSRLQLACGVVCLVVVQQAATAS